MRRLAGGALLALVAGVAHAHIIPLLPSTCAPTIGLARGGVVATVDAPGAGELFRFTYDPAASVDRSRVQVCPADPADPRNRCGAVVPRAFVVGTSTGQLAFPPTFPIGLVSSGDMRATGLPLTVTLDGTPETHLADLTTGFVPDTDPPVLGSALDGSGSFMLVGRTRPATSPPPAGFVPLDLVLSCALAPVPDVDQFALAPDLSRVRGVLTARKRTLSFVLERNTTGPAQFAGAPTLVHLGPAPVLDLNLPAGLADQGRKGFRGTDGADLTVAVKAMRRRNPPAYKVKLTGPGASPGAAASSGTLVVETGGMLARTAVSLRANRKGTRVTAGSQ